MSNLDRLKLLEQFAADEPKDPFNWYALALEIQEKQPEKALEYLKEACEANEKFRKWAKTDPFLVNIKNLPEFKKIIGENNKEQNKQS